jgi:hypothetical protein
MFSSGRMILNQMMENAEKCVVPKHEFDRQRPETPSQIHLSWQLLEDYMSQLYHLALSTQCSTARSHLPFSGRNRGSSECAVATVEQDIKSLDPMKDRISEAKYEEYYSRISSAVPDAAKVHVRTPRMPKVVKGTWMKCPAGHYYCVPPVCGAVAKTDDCCPECHT